MNKNIFATYIESFGKWALLEKKTGLLIKTYSTKKECFKEWEIM